MPEPAIRIKNLSKQYHIGVREPYRTFRDAIVQGLAAPFKRLRSFGRSSYRSEDTIWAIKDVSLEVQPGEVVGIIGRNGAGKSTLLKILCRITEPTSGYAVLRGRVGGLLEVGTGFHPELTGRENIHLSGAILGMTRREIRAKFDAMVEFSGVAKFIDTPVKRYSSGMRVRLGFAVAANLDTEILLIDEVLAVGDAEFQRKCLGKMADVGKQGRTVLFVSHNMPAVERLCTRGVLLDQGRIEHMGPVRDVTARYLQSGLTQVAERAWDTPERAPGNHVARLRAVRVRDADGRLADTFSVRDSFTVEVEFWVLEAGHQLDAGFYFYNSAGDILFVAGDFQNDAWRGRERPMGVHRSSCEVPANLLNEGNLNIMAYVCTNPHTLHAIEPDAVQIKIEDDLQEGGARGYYSREWPGGTVRPLLQWTFDYEKGT